MPEALTPAWFVLASRSYRHCRCLPPAAERSRRSNLAPGGSSPAEPLPRAVSNQDLKMGQPYIGSARLALFLACLSHITKLLSNCVS